MIVVDEPLSCIMTEMQEQLNEMAQLLETHGICVDCGKMISHDIDEPFAHCGCKTFEWTSYSAFTPYMRLEFRNKELANALLLHRVAIPPSTFADLLANQQQQYQGVENADSARMPEDTE